ncbi:uncharacterized protein LOC130010648, partial [Patella vulgata]|uniref:uncharacterized protein LOC130010648 n=1 Tax=Patella vulgata TaxID=6465 RepID=UPI0024A7A8BA
VLICLRFLATGAFHLLVADTLRVSRPTTFRLLGCVDGTQIKIATPNENENDFVNRKGVHALGPGIYL